MQTSRVFLTITVLGLLAIAASVWAAIGVGESPLFSLNTTYTADRPEFDVMPDTILVAALGGGQYRLSATIWNYGTARTNVPVRFTHTDLTIQNGVETTITTVTVPRIGSDSSAVAQCTWTPSSAYERLRVIVDPNRTMNEYRYTDNTATSTFGGGTGGGRPVIQSVAAQWDGNPANNIVGRFIEGASFDNLFWALATDPDGAGDIADVQFIYGGQIHTVTTPISGTYHHTVDMGDISASSPLIRVVAHDRSGLVSDTTVVHVIMSPLPEWLFEMANFQIGDPCYEVNFEQGVLEVSFVASDCGDWSDFNGVFVVPGGVMWLEGKECDVGVDVTIGLRLDILRDRATLFGGAEWSGTKIVSFPFLKKRGPGELSPSFGLQFAGSIDSRTWEFGSAEITANLGIDARIPAIRTYYPILPGLNFVLEFVFQLGGHVEGRLVFMRSPSGALELVEPTGITPGVDVGVTITGKAEVAFVAGAALAATPTLGLEFPLTYTTAEGTSFDFSMHWEIPWEVYVYVQIPFLGTKKKQLAHGRFGPWDIVDRSVVASREFRELNINWPDLLASPSLATDNLGHAALVWIGNTGTSEIVRPQVYYAVWDGSEWTLPDTITAGTYGRLDPYVAYAGANPVAIWTENRIASADSLTPLDTILAQQEIYVSEWQGGAWQPSVRLSNNTQPDGKATLSCAPNGRKLATWMHCTDNDFVTSTDAEVYYAFQNGGTWGTPAALTNDNQTDWNSRSAFLSNTQAVCVWVNDQDGNIATNNDTRFKYAIWDSASGWGAAQTVGAIGAGPIQGCALAKTPSGKVALAWVTVFSVADTLNYWRLLTSVYNPQTSAWSVPDTVLVDIQQLSEPNVQTASVDGQDIVQLVWRGFSGYREDFFTSLKNIDAGMPWTSAHNLTEDDFTDWMAATAIDANRNTLLVNVTSDLDNRQRSAPRGNLAPDLNFTAMGIQRDLRLSPELNFGIQQIAPDIYTHDTLIVFQQGSEDRIQFADKDSLVTIKVLLKNLGVLSTALTPVEFWRGHPDSVGSVLIATANASAIQPDSTRWISANWTAVAGIHDIYVWLDPDSVTQDRNRNNNRRHATIAVIPDLSVTNIFTVNENPSPGDTFRVKAIIANIGGANAGSYWVRFYDGHPDSASSTRLDSVQRAALNRLAFDTVSFRYTAVSGTQEIWVDVNRGGFAEETAANNRSTLQLLVAPDLAVYAEEITYAQPDWNLNATLRAVIHNEGGVGATNVKVLFYNGHPLIGGTVIDSLTIASLAGRGSSPVEITWHNTALGLTVLHVVVDPYGEIEDRDVNNNRAARDVVMLALPDLTAPPEDIVLLPSNPMLGDSVRVTINVRNNGLGDALDNVVRAYQDHLDSTNLMLLDDIIYTIPYGSARSLSFDWDTDTLSAGLHTLWFRLDPDNIVQEGTDTNNVVGVSVVLMAEPIKIVISYPAADTIHLDWHPVAGATEYKVYRDTLFNVQPVPANLIGTTSDTSFVNAGVLSLPRTRYFYVVTAVAGNPPLPLHQERPRREEFRGNQH